MKKFIAGVIAALFCAPVASFAQQYYVPPVSPNTRQCAFTVKAGALASPKHSQVTGVVCASRQAAIAVARHKRDTAQTWTSTVKYVNHARRENACREVSGLYAERVTVMEVHDQNNRRLRVTLWEVLLDGKMFLGASAEYVDLC